MYNFVPRNCEKLTPVINDKILHILWASGILQNLFEVAIKT